MPSAFNWFTLSQGAVRDLKEPFVNIPVVQVEPQTRREFCAHVRQAASMLVLSSVAACGGSSTSPSNATQLPSATATVAGRIVSITIDAASPLATVGSMAL